MKTKKGRSPPTPTYREPERGSLADYLNLESESAVPDLLYLAIQEGRPEIIEPIAAAVDGALLALGYEWSGTEWVRRED